MGSKQPGCADGVCPYAIIFYTQEKNFQALMHQSQDWSTIAVRQHGMMTIIPEGVLFGESSNALPNNNGSETIVS